MTWRARPETLPAVLCRPRDRPRPWAPGRFGGVIIAAAQGNGGGRIHYHYYPEPWRVLEICYK